MSLVNRGLGRILSHPVLSASSASPANALVDTKQMTVARARCSSALSTRMHRVAARPSITGISLSINTRCGADSVTYRNASRPSATAAHVTLTLYCAITCFATDRHMASNSFRLTGMSSTMRMSTTTSSGSPLRGTLWGTLACTVLGMMSSCPAVLAGQYGVLQALPSQGLGQHHVNRPGPLLGINEFPRVSEDHTWSQTPDGV